MNTRNLLLLGCASFALSLPQIALAQDNDEIIVTSRKVEETVLEAPVAVTALSALDLEEAGFDNIIDIANVSPGLDFETYGTVPGRQESTPFIRGIVVDANLPNPVARPVGVFIDGISVTGGTQGIGVEDFQRVEVIKGPQSATFGRATFAGAINFVTVDPSDEFKVKAKGTVATRDQYEGVLSVEGPLIQDVVTAKVTARFGSKGGHFENALNPGEMLGDQQTFSLGGTVLIEPTDNWRTKIRGYYYELDDGPAAVDLIDSRLNNFGPFGAPGEVGSGDEMIFAGVLPSQNPFGVLGLNTTDAEAGFAITALQNGNTITFNDEIYDKGFGLLADSFRGSIDTEYTFDNGITLSAIAAYNSETNVTLIDNDFSEDPAYAVISPNKLEDYSAEIRLSGNALNDKLYWSLGGNYYDAEYLNNFSFIFYSGAFSNTGPASFAGLFGSESGSTRRAVKNYGVSAQLAYDVTDKLTLSLDGRYQVDELSQFSNFVGDGEPIAASAGTEVPGSPAEFKNFLPRVTLDYQVTDNTLLYATYSEGNLPGGFNGAFVNLTPAQQAEVSANFPLASTSFDEEKLENFELGWKQRLFDNRANFSLAAFRMKRSDEVTSTVIAVTNDMTGPNDLPQETFTLNLNAQTTEVTGIEFEGNFALSDSFNLSATGAIIDSEVTDFPEFAESVGDVRDVLGQAATSVGQKAPRFAKYRSSVAATYTHPKPVNLFGMEGNWYTRADAFYTGKRFLTLVNVGTSPTSTVMNLRTGIRSDTASLELFVTNLTDEDAPTAANNTSDLGFNASGFSVESTSIGLRDRRQFGIRGSVEF